MHRHAFVVTALSLVLFAPAAMAASGGPDGFGYTYIDSAEPGGPSYGWVTVSTNSTVSSCDDCSQAVGLPFAFSFYGTNRSTVYINTNGNLTFDGGFTTWTNTSLAALSRVGIFPWWDDWDNRSASSSRIVYGTVGS